MKTPMQILLEKIENGDFLHPRVIGEFIKYNLLDKEKEVIMDAYNNGQQIPPFEYAEKYYEQTFNTKECPFYPTKDTTSATICGACGKEKFEHNL